MDKPIADLCEHEGVGKYCADMYIYAMLVAKADALRGASYALPMDCYDPRDIAVWLRNRADELDPGQ